MTRTRATPQQRPANINFESRRVAVAKEIANVPRNRINDIKMKFLLPQGKNVEVKERGNVITCMRVHGRAVYPTKQEIKQEFN